jgi:hypothetical protein
MAVAVVGHLAGVLQLKKQTTAQLFHILAQERVVVAEVRGLCASESLGLARFMGKQLL